MYTLQAAVQPDLMFSNKAVHQQRRDSWQ